MRKYLYCSTLIAGSWAFAVTHGFAEQTNPLPLKIEPPAKAEIDYNLIKEKNGAVTRARIIGTLNILSATDDGYEMSWTTESVEAGGIVLDRKSKSASTYLLGVPIRFIGDSDGLPIKIDEKDALIESIFENEAFADGDDATKNKVISFFTSMSDDVIAQVFLKAPSQLSLCHNTDLEEGQTLQSQGEVASPVGGGTILLDAAYKLSSIDRALNQAFIEFRASYNPDSLKKVVEQFAAMAAPNDEQLADEIKERTVSRDDAADCVVDTNTGWVQKMVFTTSLAADEETKSDRYEISVRWIE